MLVFALFKRLFKNTLLFSLQKCVRDTLTPISIKLNFAQVETESASAVLNVDSKRQAFVEVRMTEHWGCAQEFAYLLTFF